MGDSEQSDLEKQTDDCQNTFYQNGMHYKERKKAFIKKILSVVYFSLSLL